MTGKMKKYRHTAYDDAFRTVEQECPDALIHFINQIFGENYNRFDKVELLRNEHYTQTEGGEEVKKVTDSHFRIKTPKEVKNYHLECESSGYSKTILIRMLEYGVQDAIEDREVTHNKISIKFPKAGLVVLRDRGNPPNSAVIEFETPGGLVNYNVPIIRMRDYDINSLFSQKIYFLIPFYFFNQESRLKEYNNSKEEIEEFVELYCSIIERLKELPESELSLRSKGVIIKQMEQVIYRLAYKRKNIKDKVGDIMGGNVVKMDWLEKYDAAVEQAVEQGVEKAASKLLSKGKTVEEVAELLDMDIEKVQEIEKKMLVES